MAYLNVHPFRRCCRYVCRPTCRTKCLISSFNNRQSTSFSKFHRGILYITLTNEMNSISGLAMRGKGFRLPASFGTSPPLLPSGEKSEPTACEIVRTVESAYTEGKQFPQDIIFDNSLGEPTLRIQTLLEAAAKIKEKRHGVPITIRTNGLSGVEGAKLISTADPGDNFGTKNLHVDVILGAHCPPVYTKVMQPLEAKISPAEGAKMFSDLGSDAVTCTIVDRPSVDLRASKALASSLGAGHFEILPWIEKDFYDILGVGLDASNESIKKAYRKLAREFHPDSNIHEQSKSIKGEFEKINFAYKTLCDEESRAVYDASAAAVLEMLSLTNNK